MKKITFLYLFLIFPHPCFAEKLSTFLGIPFGTTKFETNRMLIAQEWNLEEVKEKENVYKGDFWYYDDDFVMFDRIRLFFNVEQIIKDNSMMFLEEKNGKKTYVSEDMYLFSFQIFNTPESKYMSMEKADPLILPEQEYYDLYHTPKPHAVLSKRQGQ